MANELGKPTDQAAPQDAPAEAPAPRYMTTDDFNGAMTARERRVEQRMAKQLEEFQKSLLERFAPPAPADAAPADGEQGKPSAADAEMKKATAKLEAMQRQMDAREEATAKERAEMLLRQERTEVQAMLAEVGVTIPKTVYNDWKADGLISRNAAGDLVMKVTRDYGEDEVPIATGIKEWLTTPAAKHFIPAVGGGQGSGTVIRGGAQRGGAQLSKEEAKREAQKTLTKFVLGD